MVLHGQLCGRVGSRPVYLPKGPIPRDRAFCFSGYILSSMRRCILLLAAAAACFAQTAPLEQLIDAARGGPSAPGLKDRITSTLRPTAAPPSGGRTICSLPTPLRGHRFHRSAAASPHAHPGLHVLDAAHQNAHRRTHYVSVLRRGKTLGARGDAVGYNPDSYPSPACRTAKSARSTPSPARSTTA